MKVGVYIFWAIANKRGKMGENISSEGRRKVWEKNKRKKEWEVSGLYTQFPILIVQQTVQSASSRFSSLSLSLTRFSRGNWLIFKWICGQHLRRRWFQEKRKVSLNSVSRTSVCCRTSNLWWEIFGKPNPKHTTVQTLTRQSGLGFR